MSAETVPVSVNQDWRQAGMCRGLEPEIFYPESDEEADVAKEICAQCVVRVPCLEYALARREKHGVWGGATERERRRILRQRQKLGRAIVGA